MHKSEFLAYMKEQVSEIEKFVRLKTTKLPGIDCNSCVFEWIDKNAKKFRINWMGKNK